MKRVICHYRIKCFGVGESDLEAMLPDLIARNRYPLVGITVHQATITLRITAEGETAEAARAAMEPTIRDDSGMPGGFDFWRGGRGIAGRRDRHATEQKEKARHSGVGNVRLGLAMACRKHGDRRVLRWSRCGRRRNRGLSGPSECHSAPITCSSQGRVRERIRRRTQPGNMVIALVTPTEQIRKEFPFAGHPEILRPRAAKQALNLLRLHLLGKA